jgi:hypothetical protein
MNILQLHMPSRPLRLAWSCAGLLATAGAALAGPISSAGPGPLPAMPLRATPVVAAQAPDNVVTTGVPFSYLNIVGAVFQGRNDGVGFNTGKPGCVYTTAGNARLTFKAVLPDGALVKYVRIFYYDTSGSDMTVWLTDYDGAGNNNDLAMVSSSGNGGFGTALSAELNYTVNHAANALALVATPSVLDSTQQLCGVRIAYYDPLDIDTIFKNGFD